MILDRESILAAQDITIKTVDVPEWGGSVNIRVMKSVDRDRMEATITSDKKSNLRALVASMCICDDKGVLLFTAADITALGDKSSAALDRVFEASIKLNNFSGSDIEELEKN